jgi:hypothetical protein
MIPGTDKTISPLTVPTMLRAKIAIFTLLMFGCYRAPTPPPFSAEDAEDEEIEQPVRNDDVTKADDATEEEVVEPFVPIPLTAENIKKLCAEQPKISVSEPIVFPLRADGCLFGTAPNLSSAGGSVRARELDEVELVLSQDKIICDITIASRVNTLVHDDDLYFLVDKYVVASDIGQKVMLMDQANGMYVWDFMKIRDTASIATADKVKYCVGGDAKCVAQENAAGSAFSVSVVSSEIAPIVADLIAAQAPSAKFSLIITSDDERGLSCYHDEFALDAKIDYVANPNILAP